MATKQERGERKAKRKAKREKIKVLKEKLRDLASDLKLPDDDAVDSYVAEFRDWWPTIEASLLLVKEIRLTGEAMDKKLQKVIDAGKRLYDNPGLASAIKEFIAQMKTSWGTVRSVLHVVMFVTGDRLDEKIDRVIDFGDGLTSYAGSDVLEIN